MQGKSLVITILILAGFLLVVEVAGRLFGFRIDFWFSLVLSVVLTIVLNLTLGTFGTRRRTRR